MSVTNQYKKQMLGHIADTKRAIAEERLRALALREQLMKAKKQTDLSKGKLAAMRAQSLETGVEITSKDRRTNMRNRSPMAVNDFFVRTQRPVDWEAHPMNDTGIYERSPVARHSNTTLKAFDKDKFLSRTFNRRLKMRDTFTSILPMYDHNRNTCMAGNKTASHAKHPLYDRDILGRTMAEIPKPYNRR